MKFIEQGYEIIDRNALTPSQLIEVAGRCCYKSEDRITDNSAIGFARLIVKRGHLSVLEHGALALHVPYGVFIEFKLADHEAIKFMNLSGNLNGNSSFIISGNLRAWLECMAAIDAWKDWTRDPAWYKRIMFEIWRYCPPAFEAFFGFDAAERGYDKPLDDIQPVGEADMTDAERTLHGFRTVRFITNRGVTHELVRHRPASYSQESTRYVNYGEKDMEFIKPVWWGNVDGMSNLEFVCAAEDSETYYELMLNKGWRPEQAREVLPNALKTEIVVTANLKEWRHILDLRTSNKAHPQIRALMEPLRQEIFGKVK